MGSMVMQLVDKLVNLGVRRLRCKFLCAMTLEKHWPLQSFHLRKPWARISPGISPPRRVRLGDFCQLEISLGSIVSFRLAWSTVETLPPLPTQQKPTDEWDHEAMPPLSYWSLDEVICVRTLMGYEEATLRNQFWILTPFLLRQRMLRQILVYAVWTCLPTP